MPVYFVYGNICIAPLFEIVPESVFRFVDFEYCRSMASKDVEESILIFMINDKFFYIVSNIYDIKRFLRMIYYRFGIIHFF